MTYQLAHSFPAAERYGLTAQLRRAAVSVACNIVEGSKRATNRDYAHFINVAEGSAAEAAYLFQVAGDLGLISDVQVREAMEVFATIERKLYRLRRKLLADN